MEIKKKSELDMGRFRGMVRNPWPELKAAMARLSKGDALIVKAEDWMPRYAGKKSPRASCKARIQAIAKEVGKKVTILTDPDNNDLAVIRTE